MLQLVFHTILISAICMAWGLPVLLFINKKNPQQVTSVAGKYLLLFFSGLLLLSITSSWMVLFLPLRFSNLLFFTFLVIVGSWLSDRKNFRDTISSLFHFKINLPFNNILFIFLSLLLFFVLGTASSVNIDTQLYHLQIVRWTNEYGIVPGLANIYPRLGLGSSWFNLISLFHIPVFNHQNFTYLNCTLVIWFFLWLLYKFHHARKGELKNAPLALFYFLLIIYFFFDWQLFRDTANSTSYDFVVTALIIICISIIIESILKINTNHFNILAITILAFTIVSFKFSGIFVSLLLLWQLIEVKKRNNWAIAFIAGIIILVPVLIRNYITTGYPAYPMNFSLGNPDWKLPSVFAQGIKDYIIIQNRYYNTIQQAPDVTSFFSLQWVPFWFKGILIQHKIICLAALFAVVTLFIKFNSIVEVKKFRIFTLLLMAMSVGWFITAPDPRFGYGFLLFLAFFPFCLFVGKNVQPIVYTGLQWLLMGGICFYLYQKGNYLLKEPALFLHTSPTLQPAFNEKAVLNTFNVPQPINNNWNNRCFFTPLPCLCEKNPYLMLRGNALKNGFRMEGIPDSIFIKNYNY